MAFTVKNIEETVGKLNKKGVVTEPVGNGVYR